MISERASKPLLQYSTSRMVAGIIFPFAILAIPTLNLILAYDDFMARWYSRPLLLAVLLASAAAAAWTTWPGAMRLLLGGRKSLSIIGDMLQLPSGEVTPLQEINECTIKYIPLRKPLLLIGQSNDMDPTLVTTDYQKLLEGRTAEDVRALLMDAVRSLRDGGSET